MNQPGIEIQPLRQINGAADFNQIFLTDVRTPADWIVGARGEGWHVSRTTLKHERNTASQSVQLFESLLRLARQVAPLVARAAQERASSKAADRT